MASVFKSGHDISLNVDLKDEAGADLTHTNVDYALYDDEGVELIARTAQPGYTPGAGAVTVNLSASDNTTSETAEGRRLVLYVTTAAGEFEVAESYVIRRAQVLQLLSNSFMTIEKAKALRETFGGDFSAWDNASEDAKVAALETAYRRMLKIRYKYPTTNSQSIVLDGDIDYSDSARGGRTWRLISDISKITSEEWTSQLPAELKSAMRRAQYVEAHHILTLDVAESLRRKGVISEEIGESTTIFRKSPPLDLQISVDAFRELRGYVDTVMYIGRG